MGGGFDGRGGVEEGEGALLGGSVGWGGGSFWSSVATDFGVIGGGIEEDVGPFLEESVDLEEDVGPFLEESVDLEEDKSGLLISLSWTESNSFRARSSTLPSRTKNHCRTFPKVILNGSLTGCF